MATEENVETIRKQLQCVEFMGMVMSCPILERAQTPGIGYRERGVYGGGGEGGGGPGDTSLSQHELGELLPYRVAHTASTVICAEVRCGETCQYITAVDVGDWSFLHCREMYDVCCDNNKYTFPLRCQDQVEDLKQCTRTAVADPALIRAVAAEYLLERVGHVTRDTCIRLLI